MQLRSTLRRMAWMKWLPPMASEGLHIVDEARRAADARNEDEPVVRRVERIGDFGHGALHGVQHCVVAASGAPFDLLIRFEIGGCVVVCCHNRYFRIVRLSVGSIEPISNRLNIDKPSKPPFEKGGFCGGCVVVCCHELVIYFSFKIRLNSSFSSTTVKGRPSHLLYCPKRNSWNCWRR